MAVSVSVRNNKFRDTGSQMADSLKI